MDSINIITKVSRVNVESISPRLSISVPVVATCNASQYTLSACTILQSIDTLQMFTVIAPASLTLSLAPLTIPFVTQLNEHDYLTSDGEVLTSDGEALWG